MLFFDVCNNTYVWPQIEKVVVIFARLSYKKLLFAKFKVFPVRNLLSAKVERRFSARHPQNILNHSGRRGLPVRARHRNHLFIFSANLS